MSRPILTLRGGAILVSVLVCFFQNFPAGALDATQPPGSNFDLTHWHLTLPDTNASTISPTQLVAGYTNASWFYSAGDGAMVFWCPVTGGTTANSSYPRSELRERIDPTNNAVNWTGYGEHTLDAECRVTQLPSSGKVIIGQIHSYTGNANPLLKLLYNNGDFDAQFKISPNDTTDAHISFPAVALNDPITYQIKMTDGVVSVTVNGLTKSTNAFLSDPDWTNQTFYFKAGAYCQDNSGTSSEGSRVAFYQLVLSHSDPSQSAPFIRTEPASQTVEAGVPAILRVSAGGASPLSHQWRKEGIDLFGATNNVFNIASTGTNDSGDYSVVITNLLGSITSAVARLSVVLPGPVPELTEALDTTNLVWTTTGSPPWIGQYLVSHDGEDAVRSGAVSNSASTSLKTEVSGPGRVRFWWKVSSETNNDRVAFFANGSELARISGEVNWEERAFDLASGTQALEWRYSKNSSASAGQDRAWLDQVRFGPVFPALTLQPTNRSVEAGTTVSFNVAATGTPPLSYQWRLDGTDVVDSVSVRGATTTTLMLSNVPVNLTGRYSVLVSNAAGAVESPAALLTISPVLALEEALDSPALAWVTSGTPPWAGQTNIAHDGVDAARSGAITNNQTTSMQVTVAGPGTVSFWWKVSSEPSNDRLLFYIGSSEKARITGEVDWQWLSFSVGSGSQVLKWTYSKNGSTSVGQDRGWVDEVLFIPSTNLLIAPFIAVQPVSQMTTDALSAVTFAVGAAGSAPLSYRWRFGGIDLANGGTVSGATSAALTLTDVPVAQSGAYSVVITNASGAVTSAPALLMVTPVVSLAEALDTSNLVWTLSGTPPWVGQTNVSYDGNDSARSGAVADGDSTSFQTTVIGPGTVSFWWSVSCETNNDRLRLYVDGSEQLRISGEVGWEQRTLSISSNSHVLQWKYSKNSSVTAGLDRGWVDQVQFVPAGGPVVPRLTISSGRLSLKWTGVPGRSYQVGYKDDLAKSEWQILTNGITFTGAVISVDRLIDDGQQQRFFRVTEE